MLKKAFILGAGLGTRLRPLTESKPKPTLPVLGQPIIEYIFNHLKSIGIQEIMINTHYQPHVYQTAFNNLENLHLSIQYSHEEVLLDTGGGLKKVEHFFQDSTFLMYNGDILTDGSLENAIQFHQTQKNLATLILLPQGPNPNVRVNINNQISNIREMLPSLIDPKYTFSGIHILEPEIFKHIPEKQIISIIDVYLALIQSGKKIGGFVWNNTYWNDIGDLESYQQAQEDVLLKKYKPQFPIHQLGQDGSDRVYFRIGDKPHTNIVMKYGHEKEENSFYTHISLFLKKLNLPIPNILEVYPKKGIILIEDLTDTSLCHALLEKSHDDIIVLYEAILSHIAQLHKNGHSLWQENPFPICAPFTYKTYRWESQYFKENFLQEIAHVEFSDSLEEIWEIDCDYLATLLSQEKNVLIHRDLQSKNIMIKNNKPYFIDFQGMRLGLAQYDLASLLLDPYVEISPEDQIYLYQKYTDCLGNEYLKHKIQFDNIYPLAAIQRLMQALGAYGFLGIKKNKSQFLKYIKPALERLVHILETTKLNALRNISYKALKNIHVQS